MLTNLEFMDQMDQLQRSIHSVYRLSQLLHKYLHSFLQQKELCSIMFYHLNSLQMYLVHLLYLPIAAEPLAGPVNVKSVKPETRRAYLESVYHLPAAFFITFYFDNRSTLYIKHLFNLFCRVFYHLASGAP